MRDAEAQHVPLKAASGADQAVYNRMAQSYLVQQCGFDDVRLDKYTGNYFCACCKKNLGAKFREAVRLTLPPEWVQQLDKQCRE